MKPGGVRRMGRPFAARRLAAAWTRAFVDIRLDGADEGRVITVATRAPHQPY